MLIVSFEISVHMLTDTIKLIYGHEGLPSSVNVCRLKVFQNNSLEP